MPHPTEPEAAPAQILQDDHGETHFCIGEQCADSTAHDGDEGTLTFTEGGPTGGYWKFQKEAK